MAAAGEVQCDCVIETGYVCEFCAKYVDTVASLEREIYGDGFEEFSTELAMLEGQTVEVREKWHDGLTGPPAPLSTRWRGVGGEVAVPAAALLSGGRPALRSPR